MSRGSRRRRALILLSLALASGGLAASRVSDTVQRVEARVGRPVAVLVARHELPSDSRLDPADLAVRQVPGRFAPRDALRSAAEAAGARTAVPLPAGGYVTAGALGGGGRGGGLLRGQRAVEVTVAGGQPLADGAEPGTRVDVLVSTEAGGGRTLLALQDVELLSVPLSRRFRAVPQRFQTALAGGILHCEPKSGRSTRSSRARPSCSGWSSPACSGGEYQERLQEAAEVLEESAAA